MINYLWDLWFFCLSLLTKNKPKSTAYAWFASAYMDETGCQCEEDNAALLAVTICINRNIFLDSIDEQIEKTHQLINHVKQLIKQPATPTLIAFPGGYFGYLYPEEGLTEEDIIKIKAMVFKGMENTTILMGLDIEHSIGSGMQALVFKDGTYSSVIKRTESSWEERIITVNTERNVDCAVFICGEFCNSKLPFNGPYQKVEYLKENDWRRSAGGKYLRDVYLDYEEIYAFSVHRSAVFVCLSHFDVPRTKNNKLVIIPNPLRVHQKQMEYISHLKWGGACMLTHHHKGMYSDAGKTQPHQNHRSDWILFKGGDWVGNKDVMHKEAIK